MRRRVGDEYSHGLLNGGIQISDAVLKILGHFGHKPPEVEAPNDTGQWAEEERGQNDERIRIDLSISKHKFNTPCVVSPSVFSENAHQVVPPPVAVDDQALVHVRDRDTAQGLACGHECALCGENSPLGVEESEIGAGIVVRCDLVNVSRIVLFEYAKTGSFKVVRGCCCVRNDI